MTRRAYFKEKLRHLLRPRSLGRFIMVGGINTFFGVTIFPVLFYFFGQEVSNNILLIIANVACTCSAYLWHRIVTFQSKGAHHVEGSKFVMLSVITYLANVALFNLFLPLMPAHPVVLQTIIALILPIGNYFGMSNFVFAAVMRQEKNKKAQGDIR